MSTQQKAFNIDPYYDDFDENKRFYQVLFRPSLSVQTRELIQLQTILRDQIKKFGDHIFQQGSIVIPGNSLLDQGGISIKLDDEYLGVPIDVSLFLDKKIVGIDTGVEAIVRAAIPAENSDPNTIIINYTRAGNNGESSFLDGEEIYVEENISIKAKIFGSDAFAGSTLAFINEGVYYVNGTFVKVLKQTAMVDKYTALSNAHILLKIEESIVTSDDDQSLLDPAQGEPNYAAPGADRLKINLELVVLPLNSSFGDDYIEIMRVVDGILVYHSRNPKYSELEKSLARRTYDESGDYLVDGLSPSLMEHLKANKSAGLYPPPEGDRNKFILKLTPGKAYIKGYEKEIISNTHINIDKARTSDHIKNKQAAVLPSFGQVIYVSSLRNLPDSFNHSIINFYNTSDPADPSAVNVGSARVYAVEYKEGTDIYSFYIYNAKFNGTYTYENIGGVRFGTGGSARVLQQLNVPNATATYLLDEVVSFQSRTAKVQYHNISTSTLYVYKHSVADTPKIGDNLVGATSNASAIVQTKTILQPKGEQDAPIFPIPLAPISSVRNADGDPDIVYQVSKYLTITTDANGDGSVNIDNGRIDALTMGSLVSSWAGGSISLNKFSLSATGTTLILEDGPINTTVHVQVIVTKFEVDEKTKTLITTSESGLSLTNVNGVLTAVLAKADIYKLVSIVSSIDGDVTSKFILDNGQRNYYYDFGKIMLNDETTPGGTLTVTYQYFEHSLSGDYFCINSYRNSGLAAPTELDFNSYVPDYYSTTDSTKYDLSACYDFRKIIGTVGDAIMNNTRIVSSVDYYVGRIDMYGINTTGEIVYIRGIPEEVPEYPKVPEDTLVLGSYLVPAWTSNIRAINIKQERVKRFTMKDINDLASRVGNLEEFVTLNALEADASKMEIIDPVTGLNRYKLGYLVDDFSDPNKVSDYFNKNFVAEYQDAVLKPAKEWVATEMILDNVNSRNHQVSDTIVTLPYREVPFITQPFSTKVTNVNPFLVIGWVGVMRLNPNVDSWIETEDLPDIINTVERVVYVQETAPPAPRPPAPVPAPVPAPINRVGAPSVAEPKPWPNFVRVGGIADMGMGSRGYTYEEKINYTGNPNPQYK